MSESLSNYLGIIPINKPEGWTSFDVVAKLRGILKIKRLGHAGTLDPMATGVLPIFVGKATKACDMLPDTDKCYLAGFKLGIVTDTQDISGEVLEQASCFVTLTQLEEAKKAFIGDIMQIPPMYSAVKVNGKRLYELARDGRTVERTAKKRHIESIEITEYDETNGEGKISIKVSSGTYIRTVIHDMGKALGCGAVMTSLVRTYAAGFSLGECLSIDEIQAAKDESRLGDIILPLENVFSCYERLVLDNYKERLYKNGVKLRLEQVGAKADKTYRICSDSGEFLGLAKADVTSGELRSIKNFY